MKRAFLIITVLLVLSACTPNVSEPPAMEVTSFEDCVDMGNPIMESYPRQCRHEGKTYIEKIDIEPMSATQPDLQSECNALDGNWLEETHECEWISEEVCKELGGTFNECASACRNDPEAEICTLQCVLVCQF